MIDAQQRMYMAAHDSNAREFAGHGVSEQSAYEQPSQHQVSLHAERLSREHGQQHALTPNQAPGPVSPCTPPTRSQEVRVQCEAPDCQALLQVSRAVLHLMRKSACKRT